MTVSLVAAVARGGVIGRDGGIPWRIPEDMARFRENTNSPQHRKPTMPSTSDTMARGEFCAGA